MLSIPISQVDTTSIKDFPELMEFIQGPASIKARHPTLQNPAETAARSVIVFMTAHAGEADRRLKFTITVNDYNLGQKTRIAILPEQALAILHEREEKSRYLLAIENMTLAMAQTPHLVHRYPIDQKRLVPLPQGLSPALV